jgi:hypothetical protein
MPPAKGIEKRIRLKLNWTACSGPVVDEGWLVFPIRPQQIAAGQNLVGLQIIGGPIKDRSVITVEKLEVHVHYRT